MRKIATLKLECERFILPFYHKIPASYVNISKYHLDTLKVNYNIKTFYVEILDVLAWNWNFHFHYFYTLFKMLMF